MGGIASRDAQEEGLRRMNITTMKDFYGLMAESKGVRSEIVLDLFAGRTVHVSAIRFLESCHSALSGIVGKDLKGELDVGDARKISVDLRYEITELEKDLIFLREGEQAFVEHLEATHQGYSSMISDSAEELGSLAFNCLITDRDGTTNNYCGRYRSSIQSVWNAVYLTRFAKKRAEHPVIITSGPLKNGGILSVSTAPEGAFIYAASKGRECLDLSGTIHRYPVPREKQEVLDRLNERLLGMVREAEYEPFSLIGSGLQFKFGQSTIARQDISGSIPEGESEAFLRTIEGLVREIDPGGSTLRIEDTGLDVEILLTIEDRAARAQGFRQGRRGPFPRRRARAGAFPRPASRLRRHLVRHPDGLSGNGKIAADQGGLRDQEPGACTEGRGSVPRGDHRSRAGHPCRHTQRAVPGPGIGMGPFSMALRSAREAGETGWCA
jgi:hypothetical protein